MSGFGILGTTKPSVDDIADVLEAGAGTADLARVQSSVSGGSFISAAAYGLSPSASTAANTAALAAFRAAVAAATTATQGVRAFIPPGSYNVAPMLVAGADPYADCPNWALRGLRLDATGATFFSTGDAPVFFGNGGRADAVLPVSIAGVFDADLVGLRVAAPAVGAAGAALSFTKMHHGVLDAEVIQTNGIGLDIGFSVETRIRYVISVNRGHFGGLVPSVGLRLRADAIPGDAGTASFLYIDRPVIEGVFTGVEMLGAIGNIFVGGTIEGNAGVGVTISGASPYNKFVGVDFEANAGGDVVTNADYTDMASCNSLNSVIANGSFCSIWGGHYNRITIGATASGTRIAAAYNAVDGTGYLQDLGSKTCLVGAVDAASAWVGRKYNRYTATPSGSNHVVVNTSGDNWVMSYSGGAGVLCYSAIGGNASAPGVDPNGLIAFPPDTSLVLLPGQVVELASWTTAPTSVVVWR